MKHNVGDLSSGARYKSDAVQAELDRLSVHGGRVQLPGGEYAVTKPLVLDASSLCLSGDVWSCNTDPNGVFETDCGTKLRMRGKDFPALRIGMNCDPISGAVVRDLGVQGDIVGMDTRQLMDFANPAAAAGLCLDSVRTDQCEFSKLSFCGLSSAVCAVQNAEIDACVFEKLNTDGCGNGFYFAPRASYYTRVKSCIIADNPYYGFYVDGEGRNIHNLEISDCCFVRNGGAFREDDGRIAAALLFKKVSRCAVTHCLFDAPGTFWYYDDNATKNEQRQPSYRKTVAMHVIGDENRLRDNTFLNSSDDSIRIEGNGNVLLSNIVDGNVRIRGEGNVVANLILTKPESRLILEGEAKYTTRIIGVEQEYILRV